MRITKILLTLVLVLFSLPCYATNYYVKDGGSSSACTTWTDACDQISTAENLAARGDTIYVADGAYTSPTCNTATSGTTPITIKKSTVADHGTETGYVEADHNGQAVLTGVVTFSTAWWVFDGVSRATETTGHGFKVVGATGTNTYGVVVNGVDNVTIRYTEITSPNTPIQDGCIAANTCTYAGLRVMSGTDNHIAEYLYIHDVCLPVHYILNNTNLTFRYSYIERNDSTGATHSEAFSLSYGTKNGIYIYNNKFVDIEGTAYIAVMNQTQLTNLYAYNNISYYKSDTTVQTGCGNGWFTCTNTGTVCTNVYIYNNTIANLPTTSARINLGSGGTASNWIIKNNLWFCDAASCGDANNSTNNTTYDNNWYGGITFNAAENGAIDGDAANPFTNSATYDFSLAALSGPIGQGTDLSATFTNDYALNVRSAPWDIGAYKSGEAAPDTDTPDITTKVIDATGTVLTVTLDEDVTVNNGTGFTLACANASGEGLSYVSESGGVLTFNITGVAIDDDDTCTLDYATVANGIEDAAGNDLESIGDPVAVDNQSTNTPEATSYTVTVSVGEGCSLSPAGHQSIKTGATASITCTPSVNYQCITWTGTCSGSGTTSWSATITGDCTATQPCQKIASDATIGSGCAITVGSGPAIRVY